MWTVGEWIKGYLLCIQSVALWFLFNQSVVLIALHENYIQYVFHFCLLYFLKNKKKYKKHPGSLSRSHILGTPMWLSSINLSIDIRSPCYVLR